MTDLIILSTKKRII